MKLNDDYVAHLLLIVDSSLSKQVLSSAVNMKETLLSPDKLRVRLPVDVGESDNVEIDRDIAVSLIDQNLSVMELVVAVKYRPLA